MCTQRHTTSKVVTNAERQMEAQSPERDLSSLPKMQMVKGKLRLQFAIGVCMALVCK